MCDAYTYSDSAQAQGCGNHCHGDELLKFQPRISWSHLRWPLMSNFMDTLGRLAVDLAEVDAKVDAKMRAGSLTAR